MTSLKELIGQRRDRRPHCKDIRLLNRAVDEAMVRDPRAAQELWAQQRVARP